jgi:hypothetical protein
VENRYQRTSKSKMKRMKTMTSIKLTENIRVAIAASGLISLVMLFNGI